MRKTLYCIFFLLFINLKLFPQSVSEKELFTLTYEGNPEVYSFRYDDKSGGSSYLYTIPSQTDISTGNTPSSSVSKSFIIFKNTESEKYDYINFEDGKFDSDGNFYVVAGNYAADYGADNNFLILNSKTILNFDYIESYSAFINKNNEFVFVFKESGKFLIGKYSTANGLTKSVPYDMIKPVYKDTVNYFSEGETEGNYGDNFYLDKNGERYFIYIKNNKAGFLSESGVIETKYSDINESSVTMNRNNELSFIGKKNGRFYEINGDECAVSGGKEYKTFQSVYPPLRFNSRNEPVYYCSDSLGENNYDYYPVTGDKKIKAVNSETGKKVTVKTGISDLRILNDGSISYIATDEVVIPAKKSSQEEVTYDSYFTKFYFVKSNKASEMGYNISNIVYGKGGSMLYSCIADINKNEYVLVESNGVSKIILSDERFGQIYSYGYTPEGEVFYIGQDYETDNNKSATSRLIIGGKVKGNFEYINYKYTSDGNSSALKFDSKNNYAFVSEKKIDSMNYADYININSKESGFPEIKESNAGYFSGIKGLLYSADDRLFYIGEYKNNREETLSGIFIDNVAQDKVYNTTGEVSFDKNKNEVNFFAVRGKQIYKVSVKF